MKVRYWSYPFPLGCVSSRICFIKLSAPDFEACILRVTKFSWFIVCLVSVKLPFCFSHNISYTISFIIYSVRFLYLAWNIFIYIWDHFVLLNLIYILYIYIFIYISHSKLSVSLAFAIFLPLFCNDPEVQEWCCRYRSWEWNPQLYVLIAFL